MRRSTSLSAIAAFGFLALPATARADGAAPAAPPTATAPARFAGTFRYAGKPDEDVQRRAAVDRAVDSLFFAIRGIARSRLDKETRIDPWVAIAFERGFIRVKLPSGPDAVAPETGAPVDYVSDGDRCKLTERVDGNRLVQVFSADDGKRTNAWSISPDGNILSLRVTIASPKLSTPLVYVLTYRRSP